MKPAKRVTPFVRRPLSSLPIVTASTPAARNLLFDTTVYIHAGQSRLGPDVRAFVAASQAHHCTVCLGELALSLGYLDPRHPKTPGAAAFLAGVLRKVQKRRILAPDDAIYLEASIATGILARTQGAGPADRRKLLNDALTLATAERNGLVVLTANLTDFDLLSQLRPRAQVLYYSPEP